MHSHHAISAARSFAFLAGYQAARQPVNPWGTARAGSVDGALGAPRRPRARPSPRAHRRQWGPRRSRQPLAPPRPWRVAWPARAGSPCRCAGPPRAPGRRPSCQTPAPTGPELQGRDPDQPSDEHGGASAWPSTSRALPWRPRQPRGAGSAQRDLSDCDRPAPIPRHAGSCSFGGPAACWEL